MVKFSIFLCKRADMSLDDFVAYHKNQHAALFMSIAEVKKQVRRYVQCHAIPADIPGFPDTYYHGITEIWFDDVAAIGAVFGDPEYLRLVRPDEAHFLELSECGFLITRENVVV